MSEETTEKNYTLIPNDKKKKLSFVFTKGEFKGKRCNIQLPIDFIDPETKDEIDLEFNYPIKSKKVEWEKAVGEVFLDIYGGAANQKAVEYLAKMKAEGKEVKI